MLRHLAICLAATLAIASATVVAWKVLQQDHERKVATIIQSEARAARAQLVRNVGLMLEALRNAHRYWSTYGHLPRDQWPAEAGIESVHFEGVKLILWSDPERGIRYARTAEHPVLDYVPRGPELEAMKGLVRRGAGVRGEAILGPFKDEQGDPRYEVHIADKDGTLVAVVDTAASFAAMLRNVSPGYAIEISWGETLLYRRGEPPAELLGQGSAGIIRPTAAAMWQVVHTPTADFAATMSTPALTAVLFSGIAIAALVGLLLFENWRARSRARAAEVAETKLAELNRNLEREIAERTKELADRSADLGTITDSVAHDLRNPLNSISVNTQLLEQQYSQVLGEDGMTALDRTATAVRRMTEILDRLLGLSIVSHATFHREPVNLTELFRDLFEELTASEPPPSVELVLAELPDANADPTLVRTLAMNLLSNALKYTRGREPRRIEVGWEMPDGIPVYFVRDNGVGFDARSAERLFQAFERLGRDDRSEEGIGLGLNIAVRVVRRHDGRIWAEGRPERGAAFYFTLEPESER